MFEKRDLSNTQQMEPLFPSMSSGMSGLRFLREVDSLYVKQHSSLTEIICGIALEAKFDIFNDRNERLLQAFETSTFCQRFCCATRRHFTLRIVDNQNQGIILLKREFKCCSGCTCCASTQCCSQEIVAESPPGTLIGTVSQIGDCYRSMFALKDADDNHVLTLRGPLVMCDGPFSCRCETKFTLLGTDGVTEIGAIYKKYRGFLSEAYTSADAYLLEIPMDLDVKMKALTLGALFLIEYMMFAAVPSNSSGNNNNNN